MKITLVKFQGDVNFECLHFTLFQSPMKFKNKAFQRIHITRVYLLHLQVQLLRYYVFHYTLIIQSFMGTQIDGRYFFLRDFSTHFDSIYILFYENDLKQHLTITILYYPLWYLVHHELRWIYVGFITSRPCGLQKAPIEHNDFTQCGGFCMHI